MERIKKLQDWIDMQFKQPAGDSRAPLERLKALAKRGIDAPATLNPDEVRDISFALSIYLSEEEQRFSRES